jgi:CRP-like cAMP-binding protein
MHRFCYILRGSLEVIIEPDLVFSSKPAVAVSTGGGGSNVSSASTGRPSQKQGPVKKRVGKFYGKEAFTLEPGQWFGEHGCIYSSETKSPFTIIAKSYTELLVISKNSFHALLKPYFMSRFKDVAKLLCFSYPVLHSWPVSRLAYLSGILKSREYCHNECLFGQGSTIKCIYFIKSGSVKLFMNRHRIRLDKIKSKIRPLRGLLAEILQEDSQPMAKSHHSKRDKRNRRNEKETLDVKEQVLRRYREWEIDRVDDMGICTLMKGGMLGGIESVCDLKEHFFTAHCEGQVNVYQIDLVHFNVLFEQYHPRSLQCLLMGFIEHASHWKQRFPYINLFELLVTLLKQKLQTIEKSDALKREKALSGHKNATDLIESIIRFIR